MFPLIKALKFVLILIVVIAGIVIRIRASRRYKGQVRDLSTAKTDAAYAASLVESLDFFYGGFEYLDYQSTVDKIRQIQMNQKAGSFYFGELIEVDATRFICPAKREVIMYEEKTEKPYIGGYELITFAIIINQEKSKVEVYSDIFEDTEEKDYKAAFSKALKEYLGL